MSAITFEQLSKLVYDNIAAQAKRDAERDAEWEKHVAEMKKDTAEMKKDTAEMKKREDERANRSEEEFKQLRKEFGRLGISYGEQIEAMFVSLGEQFNVFGYNFSKASKGSIELFDENKNILVEIDHLYENGDTMLPVEIKAKLDISDVNDHIKRLQKIRMYNLKHNDNRKVIGAVGGGVVSKKVKDYAIEKGLFVLVQNGNAVEVASVPSDFKPTEWQVE